MSEKINKPRQNPDVDSRLSYEEEQTQIDLLQRSGISIDWTSGTIRAKKFIGSGEGLWDVGEGTGTGPKGDDGDKGDKGDQGDQGIPGEDGEKGDKGDKGDTGDKGADGADVDSIQLDAIQAELAKQTVDISKNTADIAAHDVRDNDQDTVIEANTASIDAIEPIVSKNTADIADNQEDILTLDSAVKQKLGKTIEWEFLSNNEISAINNTTAEYFNSGTFNYAQASSNARPPVEGNIYFSTGAEMTTTWRSVNIIYWSHTDKNGTQHNFNDWLKKGCVIKLRQGSSSIMSSYKVMDHNDVGGYEEIMVEYLNSRGNENIVGGNANNTCQVTIAVLQPSSSEDTQAALESRIKKLEGKIRELTRE